jgi:hypothetical protein
MVHRSAWIGSPWLLLALGVLGGCELVFPFDPGKLDTSSGGGGAGGQGGGTTSQGGGATTSSAGGMGSTTSSSSASNGGAGGATSSAGGATSSAGGAGGALPTSCMKALEGGMTSSGVVALDLDQNASNGAEAQVYCDQVNDGGGWALVHNSVAGPASGLTFQPGGLSLPYGLAGWGPSMFSVTAPLVRAQDGGAGDPNDLCSDPVNDLAGKIVLVDRGTCTFESKAQRAEQAGAVGVLIGDDVVAAQPPFMAPDPDSNSTLPSFGITKTDSDTLEEMLQSGMVTATMALESTGTTAFWNIPYSDRFSVKGTPALDQNHYHGEIYRHGKEYRDDAVDLQGNVVLGIARANVAGLDDATMAFVGPNEAPQSLSHDVYLFHFAGGWSSEDHDGDSDGSNCAEKWEGVTQHYADCWEYSLGADGDDGNHFDDGWGPHIRDQAISQINSNAPGAGQPSLAEQQNGGNNSRLLRLSRFARW